VAVDANRLPRAPAAPTMDSCPDKHGTPGTLGTDFTADHILVF